MEDKNVEEVIETKSEKEEVEDQDDILVKQLCEGLDTYKKNRLSTFLSSFMAGLEIGFSFLVVVIVYSLFDGKVEKEFIPYLAAFVYPLGFILVVLGKSVLFTEQTSLLTLPVLGGKKTFSDLMGLWGTVILGNLVGGYLIGAFLVWIGPELDIITNSGIKNLAEHVNHFSREVILASSVLAGWLMALLSWIITSTHRVTGKILVIYVITFIIALAGLHHSIVGSIEVFAGFLVTDEITFIDYLTFQGTSLLGNALGGVVFVAILKYGAFLANNSDSKE
ncbi:formate/nitrite transporter FocA (FNT family) [Nonlabens dokdonensis]|jgi:formate/nitrite transporter FocA (FNT family)|uniref:Formate/nitrite transporter n=2 Tax=Nonlabens dokdonensis TaxID=328515 RepID=L7W8P7_NONDD|nr:formate/nitrite transporter family protein [Nonlabens dokdonensis]AGC75228.1 formate/nitrite transporter [Nonlabens dokdonensis DSW-6]PZX39031.1 formate/nitrite transporter FocA (FNT family) [Nonlabens dokdonensis]